MDVEVNPLFEFQCFKKCKGDPKPFKGILYRDYLKLYQV